MSGKEFHKWWRTLTVGDGNSKVGALEKLYFDVLGVLIHKWDRVLRQNGIEGKDYIRSNCTIDSEEVSSLYLGYNTMWPLSCAFRVANNPVGTVQTLHNPQIV